MDFLWYVGRSRKFTSGLGRREVQEQPSALGANPDLHHYADITMLPFWIKAESAHYVVKTCILYKLQGLFMPYGKMIHAAGEDFLLLGKIGLLQGFFPKNDYVSHYFFIIGYRF